MRNMVRASLVGLLAMGLLGACKQEKEEKYEPLEPELRKNYTETEFGLNLEMVYVKGGVFNMGATTEQGDDPFDDEYPVRKIEIDSYHIGKCEITQAQWKAVMGTEPSYFTGDDRPVEQVSWNDAQEFCKRLSQKTGKKYVLPTEAQWEYAAKGGNKARRTKYSGSNNLDEVAWCYDNSCVCGESSPDFGTHPVGTKKANELGIHDMSGNVWEWVADRYASAYDGTDTHNPQGPSVGADRVVRGGSWGGKTRGCRVTARSGDYPKLQNLNIGFRVALAL